MRRASAVRAKACRLPDGAPTTSAIRRLLIADSSSLPHKLLQKPLALPQSSSAVGEAGFEGAVLDFDADGAVVAGVGQGGEEAAPVDVAEAGELGGVPAEAEDANFVEPVVIDAGVLGV